MDLIFALAVVVALLLAVLAVAAWRRQRRRMAQLAATLAHTEASRRALAEQLVTLHRQRNTLAEDPPDSLDARRRELERMLATDPEAGTDSSWAETQPISIPPEGFASTMPSTFAELPSR